MIERSKSFKYSSNFISVLFVYISSAYNMGSTISNILASIILYLLVWYKSWYTMIVYWNCVEDLRELLMDLVHSILVWSFSKWRLKVCLFKLILELKDRSQYWQLWGFSPVWTRRCNLRFCFEVNILPHVGQGNCRGIGFSSVWTRRWTFRFDFVVQLLRNLRLYYSVYIWLWPSNSII